MKYNEGLSSDAVPTCLRADTGRPSLTPSQAKLRIIK